MIRFPLYRGGFIVLPSPVVKALYIIDSTYNLKLDEQVQQLNNHIDYSVKSNNLQTCREMFMNFNNVKAPVNTHEVLDILYTSQLIYKDNGSLKINYGQCIELTNYELNKDVIEAINEVREMLKKSEEMNSYINTLNLNQMNKSESNYPHIIMANDILDTDLDIKDLVNRTSFINEIAYMSKKVQEVKNEKNN